MFRLFKQKNNKNKIFFIQEDSIPVGSIKDNNDVLFTEAVSTNQNTGQESSRKFVGPTTDNKRIILFLFLIFGVIFLLFARSAHLQIVKGAEYQLLAESNRIRINSIKSARGIIYDRNGITLAENIPQLSLMISIVDIPRNEEEKLTYFQKISDLIDIPATEIERGLEEYKNYPNESVVIIPELKYDNALKLSIASSDLPGVSVGVTSRRQYNIDQSVSLSHVLGYTGIIDQQEYEELSENGYLRTDKLGKQGLEYFYEYLLRGEYGRKEIEVDALGREKSIIAKSDPINGNNLISSIDFELQEFIESQFAEMGYDKASIVVMDPNNGEVLSLISYPAYNSNSFASGINIDEYNSLLNNEDRPLFPRATSGEYPSGSTFKPIVAAAALEEGIINASTSFLSLGGIRISEWFFPDWKDGGHGVTDVRKALAESVNTFFYYIGGGHEDFTGLGVTKITEYAEMFGLGEPSQIDLPNEASGFLPSKEWKEEVKEERWYIGDTYHYAIGQGDILVTPIQVANFTSVFANGGILYKPKLINSTEFEGIVEQIEPEILNESFIDPANIEIVRQGLRQGVTDGSSRNLSNCPVSVAGKTGTAQWSSTEPPHAWFTGFAPYENPEIVITILIEEGEEGSRVAVPLAKKIINWWFVDRYLDDTGETL